MAFQLIGHLLANRRADRSLSVWETLRSEDGIVLSSADFADGGPIPRRHADRGVGGNISPALAWSGVPVNADHLVFVMEDVDVPFERPLIHVMAILPPDATALPEGALAADSADVQLLKGFFRRGYRGPRPIPGHGEHHYRFMLFAVEGDIDTTDRRTAIESMRGKVVGRGMLVGTYER